VTCNDNSVCTYDSCDPIQGCQFTQQLFCNDNNVCTNDTCLAATGCSNTYYTCPNKSVCILADCNPTLGCGLVQRDCNSSDNCSEALCDVNWTQNGRTGPCYTDNVCPFNFGLVAGISAGAAVAIAVCAGLLALAVVGGGSYALASQINQDDETIITKNPMFQAKGVAGTNPVHNEG